MYTLNYTGEQVDGLLDKINALDVATQGEDGLMSSEDKTKLDNIEAGAQENVVEGISLGGAGITPVNKVINIQLDAQPTENSTNLINSGALYTKLLSYYTKTEVDAMLAVVWEPVVVASLPTASADTMQKIYFVPSDNPETQNVKDEYITIRSGSEGSYTYSWEQIGSTAIDISGKADKDTDAVEGNLAKFDSNGNPVDAGIAAEKVAKKGEVQTFSGNLVDTRSAGTRQGPFAFRQSGGDGVNYMRKILGRTEAFNQLVDNVAATTTHNGITYTKNSDGSYSVSGTAGAVGSWCFISSSFSQISGHKYLIRGGNGSNIKVGGYMIAGIGTHANDTIITATESGEQKIAIVVEANSSIPTAFTVYAQCIDLTLEYGAGNEPATPEAFEALHPLPYYNYNAGVLKNNAATGLETTCLGANKYDGRIGTANAFLYSSGTEAAGAFNDITPYLPVYPSLNYFLTSEFGTSMGNASSLCWYDSNKQYISGVQYSNATKVHITAPATAAFVRFTTAKANGGYYFGIDTGVEVFEPCKTKTLALGLNSIPCHDENNNAVVVNGLDGVGTAQDELIVENGWGTKIIKRRGRRAYQAGDESDATLMTDGTNTDYPLATPKVLTLDNPIPALIEVDNLGTEKRLPEDTADNPQGPFECDSNYSISVANLVRKLNS